MVTVKDVYNVRMQVRTKSLAGRTLIQALVATLEAEDFFWKVETDSIGHITYLLFVTHQSRLMYKSYPEVLLLDCIYKTNKFIMPLLNIVGFAALNTTFHLRFAFIRGEQEENDEWALQQLKMYLPIAPKILLTDRELALMNAIDKAFPDAQNLLCQ